MLFEDSIDVFSDRSFDDVDDSEPILSLALNEALARRSIFDRDSALAPASSESAESDEEEELETITQTLAVQIAEDLFPEAVVEVEEYNEEIAAIEAQIARIQHPRPRSHSASSQAAAITSLEFDFEDDDENDDIFSDSTFFSLGDVMEICSGRKSRSPSNISPVSSPPPSPESCYHGSPIPNERPLKPSSSQSLEEDEIVIVSVRPAPMPEAPSSTEAEHAKRRARSQSPPAPPQLPVDLIPIETVPSLSAGVAGASAAAALKKRKASPKQPSKKKAPPRKELKVEETVVPAQVSVPSPEKPSLYQGEVLRISKLRHEEDADIDIGDDF
jgi:hypothetical protein